MENLYRQIASLTILFILSSCSGDFLEVKPDIRQRIPKELSDYRGLLDNTTNMNNSSHALGIIGSDEFFMTDAAYNSFPAGVNHNYQKRAYTWERQIFQGGETYLLDWNDAYFRISWANVILDGIDKVNLNTKDQNEAGAIRGSALFHRAYNFYNLAQLFCPVYHVDSADDQLGLPLRLDSDLTVKIDRSSLKATYERILLDLTDALTLLPEIDINNYRPSKAAVLALLARTNLQMGNYDAAYQYADQSLTIKGQLMDYNELTFENLLTFTPYGEGNSEVIFMSKSPANTTFLLLPTFHYMNADTTLIASYGDHDLRLNAYWSLRENGTYQYRGSYDGSNLLSLFTGLAVDEMYLTRAECAARLGRYAQALDDINRLRKNRVKTEFYVPLESNDWQQILDWIIEERRKELVLRGTRWEDIRRYNKESRYQKSLVRNLNGNNVELKPGDTRFVWPNPIEAVEMGGYRQNER